MLKSIQASAKALIQEMYMVPTNEDALKTYDSLVAPYEAKYPRACTCLSKDKEQFFTFYAFLAMHWQHIRLTNSIESTFATVRYRTLQTKGGGSRKAALAMVFKMTQEAEKSWKCLRDYKLIEKVVQRV